MKITNGHQKYPSKIVLGKIILGLEKSVWVYDIPVWAVCDRSGQQCQLINTNHDGIWRLWVWLCSWEEGGQQHLKWIQMWADKFSSPTQWLFYKFAINFPKTLQDKYFMSTFAEGHNTLKLDCFMSLGKPNSNQEVVCYQLWENNSLL